MNPPVRYLSTTVALVTVALAYVLLHREEDQ